MEERKGFGSNFGFLMAAIGSAVGLGNIWGFPNKMGASGGFTFLIIYLILAVICGFIVMLGELALDGRLMPVRGALGMAITAAGQGVRALVLPRANARECECVEGLTLYPAETLLQVLEHLSGKTPLTAHPAARYEALLVMLARERLCDALDVELSIGEAAFSRIARAAHEAGMPVIGSCHDFEKTPDAEEMAARLCRMAALGADMVSYREARELAEKGFLTSSCCPAFVSYIEKSFPTLRPFVSHNLSPMAEVARFIKGTDPDAKIIFIGPCTAKKQEFQREEVRPWIDCVLTFEELQAWFDSKDLDLPALDEDVLDNASYFGRIFARSGGLTDAVKQALKEQGSDFIVNPIPCDGIEACRVALLKKQKNLLKENFIEGMACVGGCIGGAGCLTHGPKDKGEVDKYGHEAYEKTITAALAQCAYDTEK